MKLRIKDIISIVVILLLGYGLLVQNKEINRQKTFLKAEQVQTDIWVDKFEQSNAKTERIEGDMRTINELYRQQTDSIETLTKKLKNKKVISYQKVDAVVSNDIVADTTMVGNSVEFQYKDKYTRVTGVLTDKFKINIEQIVPIHLMTYKQRVGLFKKTTFVQVVSTNPSVTLTGVTSMDVKNKIKRFGVGVQVGVSYLDNGFKPYLGLGLSYNFIRF